MHWLPALHEIGLQHGFKVTTFVSAAWAATPTRIAIAASSNCRSWGNWVRETVANGDFDLVVQSEPTFRSPVHHPPGFDPHRRGRTPGRDHAHAVRILARARAHVVWRCWQDDQPYDPSRHRALQRVLDQAQPVAA